VNTNGPVDRLSRLREDAKRPQRGNGSPQVIRSSPLCSTKGLMFQHRPVPWFLASTTLPSCFFASTVSSWRGSPRRVWAGRREHQPTD